jgi:hypothetical protein
MKASAWFEPGNYEICRRVTTRPSRRSVLWRCMDHATSLPGPSGVCFADKSKRATDWTSNSVINKLVFFTKIVIVK